jgi:soluble lytic murein transglycosylase
MRGALQTLTRLNAAKIGLATAALLVLNTAPGAVAWARSQSLGTGPGTNSSTATPAIATNTSGGAADTVAYAVPRDAPLPDMEVVLPQPLPPSALAQYGRILTLQDHGDFKAADEMIGRLDDTTLLGPILADRYLSSDYISSVPELKSWLAQYGSQPAAPAIYALLREKSPGTAASLPSPMLSLLPETTLTPEGAARPSLVPDNSAWRRIFMRGLNDWQVGDIAAAQPLFVQAAEMGNISDDDRATADFWSARAALRLQQPEDYLNWLHEASMADDSFYGMLAGRLLGQGFGPTGIAATLTEADITAVDATPDGHLAFALLQLGETGEAATALRALWPGIQTDAGFAHSVMAVAARAGLVDVAIAIAGQTPAAGNEIADARLPLPALHPDGGFTVDPPLVYALTRTESGFDAQAVSPAGARGLMQLMPVTAHFIARNQGIEGATSNPSANLALGQGYIHYLGEQPGINENLLAIIASYNAGPNAAANWYNMLQVDSDPLVFIETIPNAQTRRFVHQVLADSWIYAEEIGLRPRSLDDIAEGNYPQLGRYNALAAAN